MGVNLQSLHFADAALPNLLQQQRHEEACVRARHTAARALVDLAAFELDDRTFHNAYEHLNLALQLQPTLRSAFHNLTASLLARRRLRKDLLQRVKQHLLNVRGSCSWATSYEPLLWAPRFLNISFTAGKCNLRCRMCLAAQHAPRDGRLAYVTVEQFDQMLSAAPTASGATLSSADSDPLLHPQFAEICDVAARHEVTLDLFTNGHALGERQASAMVASGAVGMVNVSLDAARPQTYRRIRGAELQRPLDNIARLQALKADAERELPWVSVSMVAMEDNIAELPELVELAQQIGARRVLVEGLLGWREAGAPVRPAAENPGWRDFVRAALDCAAELDVRLSLPGAMHAAATFDGAGASGPEAALARPRRYCDWLEGVWIGRDGALAPCCSIAAPTDMGNIYDGPLFENAKYCRVKALLSQGKVFPACMDQSCAYASQVRAAGGAFDLINEADLAPFGDKETSSANPPAAQ